MQCFSRTERCWWYWQQSALFSSSGRACFLQGKEVSSQKDRHHKVSGPVAETGKEFLFNCPFSSFISIQSCMNQILERNITVKPGKPWTPEIFLECYCTAIEKPLRREKTNAQARTLVCGFVAGSHVLIFAVIGRNTINILEIFQVFIVFPVTL